MAASVAFAAVGGTMAYDHLAGRISTDHGEVRRIALEDGSVVMLNGNSAVQVRYQDDMRRVILRRGEASFEVAHNVQRPFVVSAEGLDVRPVGTAFVVGLAGRGVGGPVGEGCVHGGGAPRG